MQRCSGRTKVECSFAEIRSTGLQLTGNEVTEPGSRRATLRGRCRATWSYDVAQERRQFVLHFVASSRYRYFPSSTTSFSKTTLVFNRISSHRL